MNNTNNIYAGCTMLIILAVTVLCLSLLAAALAPVHAESVEQVTLCTPIAYVRVINGLNASIRTSPEVTTDNRNRIGNLTYQNGEKAAWEFRNGFYHLCEKSAKNEEQWVSATYNGGQRLLDVRPAAVPTSTFTPSVNPVTPSPSPTATRRGVTPSPAPTFTNVPDLPRYLVIDQYGSPWECSDELPAGEVILIYHRQVLPCALAPVVLSPTPTKVQR